MLKWSLCQSILSQSFWAGRRVASAGRWTTGGFQLSAPIVGLPSRDLAVFLHVMPPVASSQGGQDASHTDLLEQALGEALGGLDSGKDTGDGPSRERCISDLARSIHRIVSRSSNPELYERAIDLTGAAVAEEVATAIERKLLQMFAQEE